MHDATLKNIAGSFIWMRITCFAYASSWVLIIIITKPHLLHLTHDEPLRRRPTAHGRFSLLWLSCCPNGTYGCVWNCAQRRLLDRGDEKVAVSRAKRLSLSDCLYKSNAKKYMGARARATDAAFSSYAIKALCWWQCCLAHISWLYLYLTAFLLVTIKYRTKCLIFLSNINSIWIFSTELW
jgi:hypothetical protein